MALLRPVKMTLLGLATKYTKKPQGITSAMPSLRNAIRRPPIEAELLSSRHFAGLQKRHFTTSKPSSALGQELVNPAPYPFQPPGSESLSPRTPNIPWRPSVEHITRIPELMAKVDRSYSVQSKDLYWQKIPWWSGIPEEKFLSQSWQGQNDIKGQKNLLKCLQHSLPDLIPRDPNDSGKLTEHIKTRDDFIQDVKDGMAMAPMAVRLSPHIWSVIDWSNPLTDPIRRQFIPMKSAFLPNHEKLEIDSLHEEGDSPVEGLVHRYPEKALFLATSVCPVYCRFCTRSYSIGDDTESNSKTFKGKPKHWPEAFKYIERTPTLSDIVVSGGDSYLLTADQLTEIGEKLLSIPHIRRFRFATKGLAVCPGRILDEKDDWTKALIALSNKAKKMGKAIAVHTHFNHPNEITWVTRMATQKLFENGVMVRNQSVLLRGVNDNAEVMGKLIRNLADINVQPYYVYQGDMVKGVEDLRTPLQTILDIESQLRGSIAGFMFPNFVVDLPGGGGKRLAASFLSYDRTMGVSKFTAPSVSRNKGGSEEKIFEYYDPIWSVHAYNSELLSTKKE